MYYRKIKGNGDLPADDRAKPTVTAARFTFHKKTFPVCGVSLYFFKIFSFRRFDSSRPLMVRFFSSSPCQTFLILYTFLFSLPLFLSGEAVFWWFKMQIEKVKIADLREYEGNAKLHPQEQQEQIDKIKKSIQEFGNNDPIAVDENNVIIEGHGRLQALEQLGYTEAEVIRLSHLSEDQKKAYILVHNKLNMDTGFDTEMLRDELDGIFSVDMADFGFDLPEAEILNFSSEVEEQILEAEKNLVAEA